MIDPITAAVASFGLSMVSRLFLVIMLLYKQPMPRSYIVGSSVSNGFIGASISLIGYRWCVTTNDVLTMIGWTLLITTAGLTVWDFKPLIKAKISQLLDVARGNGHASDEPQERQIDDKNAK